MDISLELVCRLFHVALCWYDLAFSNLEVWHIFSFGVRVAYETISNF